jgi:ligand-binding sensor domain-containing protein
VAFALTPKKVITQYAHETWTTEDGLPQNSINDILQTRDGYLWLATFGGLVRFDGAQFVVFNRSIEGIKSQRIKALYEDKKGTLWAGTEEGMLIRYREGEFTDCPSKKRSELKRTMKAICGLPDAEWLSNSMVRISLVIGANPLRLTRTIMITT